MFEIYFIPIIACISTFFVAMCFRQYIADNILLSSSLSDAIKINIIPMTLSLFIFDKGVLTGPLFLSSILLMTYLIGKFMIVKLYYPTRTALLSTQSLIIFSPLYWNFMGVCIAILVHHLKEI